MWVYMFEYFVQTGIYRDAFACSVVVYVTNTLNILQNTHNGHRLVLSSTPMHDGELHSYRIPSQTDNAVV